MDVFDMEEIYCSQCGILIEGYEPPTFCGEYLCDDCMDFMDMEYED